MPDIKRPMGQMEQPVSPERMRGESAEPMITQSSMRKKSGLGAKLAVIVIIIVVLLIGLFLVSKYTSWNILNVDKGVSSTGWQAVFLTNGQVYFGKVAKNSGDILVLKDIYYLQVTQQIQPTEANQVQDQSQNLSLVKLGNELHGPKDEMRINRSQVLFTEDLKADSKVVDAIIRYKQDQAE